ncbi:MAG: trypsin-like peptidase domain-containing protein, partial [Chloroflexota bacterium]|nr:trypsin-like peptidase domain-containing protein [Chloroflexota bacterium]
VTKRDVAEAIASALASQTPGPPASQRVYDVVRPSLVLIQTDRRADGSPASPPPAEGVGTGVVIDQRGRILTALHVVREAAVIRVTFADGSTSRAAVVARDEERDIAVLRPATIPASVVPATIGNAGAMRIGSDAYVVGNPFGLYASLSAGVVSGLDRTFQDPDTRRRYVGLIQVDAAVNPGNSGGPLLDRAGRVVGIVTALVNPTNDDVFIGIGLAVPINATGGAAGLPPY